MKKLLLFVLAVIGFAACTQDVEVQVAERHDAPDTITVGFEGDETRIQLNEAQKTVWNSGDEVSVFYKSDANQKYEYRGETGERTAELQKVSAGSSTTKMGYVVVAYPYSEEYIISPATGNLETMLPAVQHYAVDSYGVGDNLMVSCSEFTQFSLKSVCGWLKLQLTGNGEVVKRIKFRGNNGEQVAGLIHVDTKSAEATLYSEEVAPDDNGNANGSLVIDGAMDTEVMLYCDEGVTLSSEATAFYIALPPQTFEQGFTVDVICTDGTMMAKSSDKRLSIERNHIQPMAAFEFVKLNSPTLPTPASNEIWYSATAKVEPTFDDFLTFGSDLVSNVWDSNTKRGIITFDGEVTMIGDDAFNNCDKLTGITLPESVTSIGKKACYDCDGLTEFTIPDSVTEVGADAFYSCGKLVSVTIGDSVTTIGYEAFYDCDSLIGVTIGDSVTTIGEYAFYSCDSLTSVNIPDKVTTIGEFAFADCSSLTSVNIPDSVTTIGYYAFYGCDSLTEFTGKFAEDNGRILVVDGVLTAFAPAGITQYTIPDSVTTIGSSAFSSCDSLTSVNIPDSVTSIGGYAFYKCTSLKKVYCYASIPPSLGGDAFYNNASARRIYVYEECVELYKSAWSYYEDSIYTNGQNCPETTTIQYTTNDGNTITSSKLPIISNIYENGVGTLVVAGKIAQIPYNAFYYCEKLTSVTIPDSVTEIGDYAFYSCESLTSVTIPDRVTTIGEWAFAYCDSLTSVNIGDSVTIIGECAFDSCYRLTSVNIPDSVTEIGGSAFRDCESLTSVNIPDSVTTIRSYAFAWCSSLTSLNIPDSVTEIGDYAFRNCESLTSVNIPDSVTTIGECAFDSCYSLTSITIPNSVTTIGSDAFYDCSSLTSVYCKATTPPVLGGTDVFDYNGSGRKIYVPAGSVNAYKSAEFWNEYASAIVGYDFENDVVVE